MSQTDVFFCRRAVVNHNIETKAYHFLLLNDAFCGDASHYLGPFLFDVDIKSVAENNIIFVRGAVNELSSLPARNTEKIVIFLETPILSENELDVLLDARLQGYQFGIINPDLRTFSVDWLSAFNYVLFTLENHAIEELVQRVKHPLIASKCLWINGIQHAEQFNLFKDVISNGLFSGDFIKKSTAVKGKRILTYKVILIELLAMLNDNESSPKLLAQSIERDPTLTYRLIKLTRSAFYYSQFNVVNAQRAIEIIGIRDLIKWVSLAMLTSVPGKPNCLFSMALSRACFCEEVSDTLFPKLEGAFLVGLFSYLPSFLDESLPLLLEELPLEENMKMALLHHKGHLGSVLKMVEAYEAGRWEKLPFDKLGQAGMDEQKFRDLYVKSLSKAKKMGIS